MLFPKKLLAKTIVGSSAPAQPSIARDFSKRRGTTVYSACVEGVVLARVLLLVVGCFWDTGAPVRTIARLTCDIEEVRRTCKLKAHLGLFPTSQTFRQVDANIGARTLLGAPGLTTRSKNATKGNWPYY